MTKEQSAYRFTLVHGTFGANTSWVNDDQALSPHGFRARLAMSIEQPISYNVPPPWGSRGSLFKKLYDLTNAARITGAQTLKKDILATPKVDGEKHFLLAHSHGGNVAMYALQDPEVQDRIDGLICLATPFLFPRRRPLSISTLVLSLIIMSIGVVQMITGMNPSAHGWLAWAGVAGLLTTGVVIPALLVWVVVRERYQRKIKQDTSLDEHVERVSYSDPGTPVLLVRSSGDEASGLLRGTQFLNWVAGMVMRIGGKQIYGLICLTALILLWIAYIDVQWVPDGTISFLSSALIISALIMILMLASLTLSRIAVGLDAWRWVGELETMVEDGPPGVKSELVVITPRLPEGGLSHTAIFSESETTNAIADWCRSERYR